MGLFFFKISLKEKEDMLISRKVNYVTEKVEK